MMKLCGSTMRRTAQPPMFGWRICGHKAMAFTIISYDCGAGGEIAEELMLGAIEIDRIRRAIKDQLVLSADLIDE